MANRVQQPTYVYCTKDHRFATICTSLIRQQIEHDEETFPTLHQMILNEEQDKVLCLDKALLKLMQSDDRIFIIDGLDKLRDDDREKVLQLFLPGNSPSKVLLVSTDLGDMRKCLAGLNNSAEIYELLPVNTQKDIARYTVEQILSLEEEFSQISPKYRRHIYDACCNTAGVFSRASQRMEKLFRHFFPWETESTISLPPTKKGYTDGLSVEVSGLTPCCRALGIELGIRPRRAAFNRKCRLALEP
ncbi:hypothetical protein EDB80DRAFT_268104 [Ilyonectria destructans]|nr:hypothetical protein EDB80DRAFT_268104 [Ilyonectria destructans]